MVCHVVLLDGTPHDGMGLYEMMRCVGDFKVFD